MNNPKNTELNPFRILAALLIMLLGFAMIKLGSDGLVVRHVINVTIEQKSHCGAIYADDNALSGILQGAEVSR